MTMLLLHLYFDTSTRYFRRRTKLERRGIHSVSGKHVQALLPRKDSVPEAHALQQRFTRMVGTR